MTNGCDSTVPPVRRFTSCSSRARRWSIQIDVSTRITLAWIDVAARLLLGIRCHLKARAAGRFRAQLKPSAPHERAPTSPSTRCKLELEQPIRRQAPVSSASLPPRVDSIDIIIIRCLNQCLRQSLEIGMEREAARRGPADLE